MRFPVAFSQLITRSQHSSSPSTRTPFASSSREAVVRGRHNPQPNFIGHRLHAHVPSHFLKTFSTNTFVCLVRSAHCTTVERTLNYEEHMCNRGGRCDFEPPALPHHLPSFFLERPRFQANTTGPSCCVPAYNGATMRFHTLHNKWSQPTPGKTFDRLHEPL